MFLVSVPIALLPEFLAAQIARIWTQTFVCAAVVLHITQFAECLRANRTLQQLVCASSNRVLHLHILPINFDLTYGFLCLFGFEFYQMLLLIFILSSLLTFFMCDDKYLLLYICLFLINVRLYFLMNDRLLVLMNDRLYFLMNDCFF